MPMAKHVDLLGWLYLAYSILGVLMAVFVFVIVVASGLLAMDPEAVFITTIVGSAIGAFIVLLSVPGIVAGIGLLKRWSWARILALVLGVLNLFSFPLGTILGVYTLWVLLNDEAARMFTA